MEEKLFEITESNVETYVKGIAYWIKKEVEKAKRNGVILGMSGGVDCSVVARLCQIAEVKTHLVLMPYGNSMENSKSKERAMELINKFNFSYHIYDIKPAVDCSEVPNIEIFNSQKRKQKNIELAQSNLRPRERMKHLYQVAQTYSLFVIGTGNLAERTTGYFTKWGDGAYDINPIAMLTKHEVYILAKYLKIPESIINEKPSAELWEGQTDEEELGMTYEQIDKFILTKTSGNKEIDKQINKRKEMSKHKHQTPIFNKNLQK